MLRTLKLLILIPLGAAIIGLAVINRAPVKLTYWPQQLGGELTVNLPLFLVLLLATIIGVVIGSLATWLAQGSHRRSERQLRREAERLKSEAERLKAMQPAENTYALPMLKSR
ncbi:MAG: lipopolysaccharide assembly protein LapA domain-containing protein [Beijerinckiaceae bacterium]